MDITALTEYECAVFNNGVSGLGKIVNHCSARCLNNFVFVAALFKLSARFSVPDYYAFKVRIHDVLCAAVLMGCALL